MKILTWFAPALLWAVASLAPTTLEAAPIVDQSYDAVADGSSGGINVESDQQLAQTFTVGVTGTLVTVEVQARVSTVFPPGGDLLLDIRPTVDGVPVEDDSLALASVAVPVADVPPFVPWTGNFVSVDLSPFSVHVTAGEVLAIVLRQSGTGSYIWLSQVEPEGVTYAKGAGFSRRFDPSWGRLIPETDFGFRTSVVPEPATLALIGLGLVGIGAMRRRKQS